MSTSSPTPSAPSRARGPIRVVPLHIAPAPSVAPVPGPKLTYRGGPLLTAVEVVTIFWGPSWQAPPQADLSQQINQFFDFVLTSALLDQMSEYSVAGKVIGHGTHVGTVTLAAPAPGSSIDDSGVQQLIQGQISTKAVPPPTPNSLYFVFLPPGVSVSLGSESSCTTFCGYHSDINAQIFYAVMPYPDCAGCVGGLTLLDAVTTTTSHELCEAITDPIPGQGWYDDQHGEIGDICAWKARRLGAYSIQLEWSNQAANCV